MVTNNQLYQYFQFVKDMLLEKVISEPLIHSACYINQWFGHGSNTAMYTITSHTVGLYRLKSIKCRWRLVPCYDRAGHICKVEVQTLEYL